MIPWLLFPGVADAASLSLVFSANFTLTGADGPVRPGFDLSLATQVVPVRVYGAPTPTVGLVAHRRWVGGGHRRWMLGTRFGASAFVNGGDVVHTDFFSAEAEFGVRLSGEHHAAGYGGGHLTVAAVFGGGFDSEFVAAGDRHGTGYLGVQLPIPPLLGIEGRAFRVAGGRLLPMTLPAPGADPDWIARGRDELASVATFLRLAAELSALRAPLSLVDRARMAATEELGHARACFALAGGGLASPLRWTPRRFPSREVALRVLGTEALHDGAENEAAAALQFERRRDSASSELVSTVSNRIAREERGHAALGHDIARWCGVAA